MSDLLICGGFALAGYLLAVWTWPKLRTFLVGVDQEIAWLKARASELEAKLRNAFGGQG